MDLLGSGALALAVLMAAVGLVGGTWLQSRITRRGLAAAVQRLATTALACLLVVAATGVELNRRNGWYATSNDLLGVQGQDHGAVVTVTPSGHTPGGTLPPLPRPHERLQSYVVRGPSGLANRVLVLLPEGYQAGVAAGHKYPVLLLGHGMPGSVHQWVGSMDIRPLLDPLVRQGRFAASVVVLPQLTLPDGRDSECIAGPGGGDQMERWLSSDVPNFVLQHFAVRSEPAAWAAMGFSAGAWCSSMLALLHPQRFGAGISLAGYFRPLWVGRPPVEPGSAAARRLDLVHLAGHRPPATALYLQSTLQDPTSGPPTREFARAAAPPLQVSLVMEPTGGHRPEVWLAHVPRSLAWLATTRPAFA